MPWKWKICICVFAVAGAFIWLDGQIRPVVEKFAATQAKIVSSVAMNNAIIEQLEKTPVSYADLVRIEYGASGTVRSLQIDSVKAEKLQETLINVVGDKLKNLQEEDISVPLGTVLGWQMLSRIGPNLRFSILPASYVQGKLESEFEACGVNQTRHRIVMHVTVNMTAFTPGFSAETVISSDIVVAETVIVGEVPQWYGGTLIQSA
ncbi:MAG: sporulation protein YunB [Oscillospiraceae bacterium]|nr:sporulation protein YunB [Oscillospiraceae bacterium]